MSKRRFESSEPSKRLQQDPLDQLEARCSNLTELWSGAPSTAKKMTDLALLVDQCNKVLAGIAPSQDPSEVLLRVQAALDKIEVLMAQPATPQWLSNYFGIALEADMPIREALWHTKPVLRIADLARELEQAIDDAYPALIKRTGSEADNWILSFDVSPTERDTVTWVLELDGQPLCGLRMSTLDTETTSALRLTFRRGFRVSFALGFWIEEGNPGVIHWRSRAGDRKEVQTRDVNEAVAAGMEYVGDNLQFCLQAIQTYRARTQQL